MSAARWRDIKGWLVDPGEPEKQLNDCGGMLERWMLGDETLASAALQFHLFPVFLFAHFQNGFVFTGMKAQYKGC